MTYPLLGSISTGAVCFSTRDGGWGQLSTTHSRRTDYRFWGRASGQCNPNFAVAVIIEQRTQPRLKLRQKRTNLPLRNPLARC